MHRHKQTGSYVYHAALRAELTRTLGLQWTPVDKGIAEIAGVPKPLRRLFSTLMSQRGSLTARRYRHSVPAKEAPAMRKTVVFVAVLALWLASGAPQAVASTPKPDSCRQDEPPVVDGTLTISNLVDLGSEGHVWALDAVTERVRVWQIGPRLFCVKREADVTWISYAGISPAGTGTISAGVTGTAHGIKYLRVSGAFTPAYPTSGNIGNFDAQCQPDGTCTGLEPRIATLYFPQFKHLDFGWFDYLVTSSGHGTWHQTPNGDTGDITG